MTLPTLCEHCHNRAHRDDIRCTESCYSLDAYNNEIAKAIAARDKWWVAKAFSLLDKLAPTLYSAEDAFTIRKFIDQLKREVGNER